jgi:hypothetical protein
LTAGRVTTRSAAASARTSCAAAAAPTVSRYTPDSGVGEDQRDTIQDFRSGQDRVDLTAYGTVRNLAVEDHGDGLIVAFEAFGAGRWVAQEIEVFGARALADGDIIIA